MKKLNYFFVFLFFILSFIIFLPQKNIFYLTEKWLAQNQIYISNEMLNQKPLSLDIENLNIMYEGIAVGTIQDVTINILGFYNKIAINNAILKAGNFTFIPKNIMNLDATYNVLSPLKIVLTSENDLGSMTGFIHLSSQKLFLELKPSKDAKIKYANILKAFTAQKEGLYTYEKNIKLY